VFFAASNRRSAVEAAEHTQRHRHRRFTRDKRTKALSFKLSLQRKQEKEEN